MLKLKEFCNSCGDYHIDFDGIDTGLGNEVYQTEIIGLREDMFYGLQGASGRGGKLPLPGIELIF